MLGLLFSLIFLRGAVASPNLENTQPLKLVDRSVFEDSAVNLPSHDWQWVRSKRVLTLGVGPPDFAPIEIISSNTYYEGFTADVIGVIGKLLHIEIRVIQFADREMALNALELGLIDMVGSANNYELASHRVQLSQSYIPDHAVLYVRKSEERSIPVGLDGMRVALADDYLPMPQLKGLYPNAIFVPYKSREQALAALAFGGADLYLGDTVSSNYLVNLNYFNYVRTYASLDMPVGGFAFAIRSGSESLGNVLNAALKVVREYYLEDMLKRWSGGGSSVVSKKLELSSAEQRWIVRHPIVRFIVSNDTAPMSYFDSEGRFSGISADILKAVSLRTGLVFKAVRADEADDHLTFIKNGEADLTALTPTAGREEVYRFTRPIVFTPFAIITRNEVGQPASVAELHNKRLALPLSHSLRELLQPASDFHFVEAATLLDAMEMVVNGQADATATFLPVAQYYTMTLHGGSLKISNIIENSRATLAFAMRKSDTELASILDKALLQIPPDEIDIYQNRWRPKFDASRVSWLDYRSLIYKIGGAAFIFILLSFAWNFYIRSQYKRRQQAELALSEQLNFMRSLINDTPHPIYVRDRQGRMLTCNSSYLEVLGTTEEAVIGRTTLDGVKVDRQEALQFHDDYMRVMELGEPMALDRVLHLPGRELSIYHWAYPYYDASGQIKGVICGWIDVSDRRQLMEELRTALDVADQSSRAKTTFLATMSHEIRTPMSAVIGMLELAMKHADQGRFDRPAIEVAYDSARGLLELIGDILDVVRIESGHVSLSPRRANLRELVESVARVFDGLARQKALTLSLHIDANVNRDVLVDPMRFKQVLSNLVGNAIKFTDTGTVKVTINGSLIEDDRLLVELSVEDSGIGISADELAKLFQPFAQANHGRTSRGGTGLGLAISKSLCELMGGKVAVRSEVGKGTSVTLEIPFNILPEVPRVVTIQEEDGEKEHPTLNVLVVDDQQANRVLLMQQLVFFGQVVACAQDGGEGLQCWEEGAVDMVITDCNMPVMNGYEMARKIREVERQSGRRRCVIIGFTANAQPEEKAKCLEAGMDDCLFKPISLTALSAVLMSFSGVSRTAALGAPQERVAENAIEPILYSLTGGDKAMMQSLIEEAYSSYTRDLAELKGHLVHIVPDALADLAHRIKGAARILQAQRVIQACDQVERLCRDMPIQREQVLGQISVIEEELERLIEQVRTIRFEDEPDNR
ncbi:ATP-binding protein [Pseudomonas chlororaphis]|uniref:histidine kinase n=1 Tax=Pseudomonas chlororaphis O6 TaxID=1037915 RepID=A0AB33X0C4_9PSED|nr:transporter substrate-binding domain-containing protein [Pseudomonas chlororaphis]EIM18943.1 sensory box histidine kinase/response regulator RocS1 [Pseudomonas chlororaphis O6]